MQSLPSALDPERKDRPGVLPDSECDWCALPVRIFEKEVRCKCSYLSLGTIESPVALPRSCSYSIIR